MLLVVPAVLAGPLLLLAAAVVALWARGPVGWVAAAALLAAVWRVSRWCLHRVATWWRGTKAPDLDIPPEGPVRHNG